MKKKTQAQLKRARKIQEYLNVLDRRITRGIAWLDKELGREEWLAEIDETKLRLSSAMSCVCGQLFEDFWKGVERLCKVERDGLDSERQDRLIKGKPKSHGFYIDDEENDEWDGDGYDMLTRLWFHRISRLRMEADMGILTPPPTN